jgi:hypothetical protein
MPAESRSGHPGDHIAVLSPSGAPARHGEIVEVLGATHHEHYRVRWEDGRESIHYPSDGTKLVPVRRPSGES